MQSHKYSINRKRKINNKYFDTIDTPGKAYWLGFIWADGGWSKTAPRCSGPNRLTISQKDHSHLKLFLREIESNAIISENTSQYGSHTYRVDINSRPICIALENLGFGKKDERIHIPTLPKEFHRDFIRGLFDGDGCLSIYTQNVDGKWNINRQEWSITGNKTLPLEIQRILEEEAHVSKDLKLKEYQNTYKSVSLRYGRKADIENLFEYLYSNTEVFLTAKYNKFVEFFHRGKNGRFSNALRIPRIES